MPTFPSKPLTVLVWLAVLFAATEFTLRGPLRASSAYVNDLAAPYVSARLWLHHQNPYDPAAFFPEWHAAGAPPGPVYANPSSIHSVYPPPSLIALLPFSVLPWPVAAQLFTLLSAAFYVAALIFLAGFIPGSWHQLSKPVFLAYGLLFAPAQTALHVTNVACLSASLLFLALYLLLRTPPAAGKSNTTGNLTTATGNVARAAGNVPNAAGNVPNAASTVTTAAGNLTPATGTTAAIAALLTLSLCLKPTLAPIVLLYLLWGRLWRTLIATLSATLLVSIAALLPLLQRNPDWFHSLGNNVRFVFLNGTADLSAANPIRFDRIDLQLPAYLLTKSRTVALLAAALVSAALLALCLSIRRHPASEPLTVNSTPPGPTPFSPVSLDDQLLRLSALLVIGLLPTYQRIYSAILLLIPVVWAMRKLAPRTQHSTSADSDTLPSSRRTSLPALSVLGVCSIFLVNTSVLPLRFGLISSNSSLLANTLVGAHLCWVLLLVALLLTVMVRSRSASSQQPL